jgi:heme exporter protein D
VWGLRTAGVSFAVAVAVLAIVCLVAIMVRERRLTTTEI